MRTKYVRIMCSARRGDRPPYTYVVEARVRASKMEDFMCRAAWDIAEHENRSRTHRVSIVPVGTSVTVRVGICSFTIYAIPMELEGPRS
jgi:hypothetical protein